VNDANHIFGVKGRMEDKRFPAGQLPRRVACVTPVTRTLLPQWSHYRARPLCKQPQRPCISGAWKIEGTGNIFVFPNDKLVASSAESEG
jgi:hypothetical protein